MRIQTSLVCICVAIGTSQLAFAEKSPFGSAESDLRRIVVESAEDGIGSVGALTAHVVTSSSLSDELLDKCAMTDFQYWDLAGRRIAEGSRQKGRRLRNEISYVAASSRDDLLRARDALHNDSDLRFLEAGDRLDRDAGGYAQDLRQRAEWSALLDSLVGELEQAYIADSNEASTLFAVASWERTRCNFAKRNARVLDRALSQVDPLSNAPEAAKWTPETYGAMTEIALASNDPTLAAKLLALPADRFKAEALMALRRVADAG